MQKNCQLLGLKTIGTGAGQRLKKETGTYLVLSSSPYIPFENNFSSVVTKVSHCLPTNKNVTTQHGTS
jgi:hypothetical protein